MPRTAIALVVTLLAVVPAFGQEPASDRHPFGLDPYKPSDAALLRNFGVVLVAQTPLLELRKLDPYKPSHAALLRELGGGLPLWGLWYPAAPPAALTLFPTATSTPRQAATTAAAVPLALDGITTPPATSVSTLRRPEGNDGVWIRYADQKWIGAGKTVPFEDPAFVRVGEYGRFPVFKRTGDQQDVIYVPTRDGLMAPYRLKP